MPLLLSIVALVAAALAILVAWRASRAAHRLALEMVQLRDRLKAAEAHYDDAADVAARAAQGPGPTDPALLSRLSDLEGRLRASHVAEGRPAAAPAAADDATRIRRHLLREGYAHVTVLATTDDGRCIVEAEREGITSKGSVGIDADGTVRWEPVDTLRAFP